MIGGGLAGSAAALAALSQGARVCVFEKSRFPRHKVCGEFLSPEAAPWMETLGLHPASISRVVLHLGSREKRWRLAEPGFGISRHALDHAMLRAAIAQGAEVRNALGAPAGAPTVLAHGRQDAARGARLFGFKAHFTGPCDDTVRLYFFDGCYVGVSPVEDGRTNVCGLAPEPRLRAANFEIEPLLARCTPLARRLDPLSPAMEWLVTGPLVFRQRFSIPPEPLVYRAGDALGFIDPFTGSGMLTALVTGRMAGIAAARGTHPALYLKECRRTLRTSWAAAALFRAALRTGAAGWLASLVPGRWLFDWTRPATNRAPY